MKTLTITLSILALTFFTLGVRDVEARHRSSSRNYNYYGQNRSFGKNGDYSSSTNYYGSNRQYRISQPEPVDNYVSNNYYGGNSQYRVSAPEPTYEYVSNNYYGGNTGYTTYGYGY